MLQVLNYCKETPLPIFLQVLNQYSRRYWVLYQRAQSGDPLKIEEPECLQRAMMEDSNRLAIVQRKIPKSIAGCLELNVRKVSPPGPVPTNAWRQTRLTSGPKIALVSLASLTKYNSGLASNFRVMMRACVSTFCLSNNHAMPSDWGWCHAQNIMYGHVARMRRACSSKWATVETDQIPFLECFVFFFS